MIGIFILNWEKIQDILLEIRYMNAHQGGTAGKLSSLSSFKAASRQFQSAIINNFGDPMLDRSTTKDIGTEENGAGGSADLPGEEVSSANRSIRSEETSDHFEIGQAPPLVRADNEAKF
jgi:hypothetical protein